MNGPAHLGAALFAAAAAAWALGAPVAAAPALALGAAATAKLPDIDREVNSGPNHRSVTHSAVIAGLPALATGLFAGNLVSALMPAVLGDVPVVGALAAELLRYLLVGAAVGYLSHLLLDALTPKRIPLLVGGSPRFGFPLVNSKRYPFLEPLAALSLTVAAALVGINLWAGGVL